MNLQVDLLSEDIGSLKFLSGERYKAKIAFVSPHARRNSFEQESQCFIGVSLENRNFTPTRFQSMVEWAARRFEKCGILIGDHIHRLTLQSTRNMSAETARSEALKLGSEFMEESQIILDAYRHCTDFHYLTCSDIQGSTEYENFYSLLKAFFLEHPGFRESVETFGRNYHRHQWSQLSEEQQRECLEFSSQYFLEEFSVFACLVRKGFRVMAYPGAFSTLAEIAAGDFPGVLDELKELTVVSLQLKRR
ncbi:tRNA-dependent cyclodipeptide synthase [Pseudomonas sp. KFB-139]|uniref:Cyclodipeptide synthase n=1 Tax=Pseudomonas serbiensis TaxID=3064350 RepID=A0ABT9CID8_9PSED|nr:tRNA-dependent cyclodipeptide synthase [Pseudomonas sp. KFB-138]MDO7925195.1 tRNA-dependent cyclodipeptide synthase [Pseudomonas sp. KFB-138]